MRKRGTWSVGRPATRACGGTDTWEIDPVENGAEYSGGVEGVDGGSAAGRPDGMGGAESSYTLDSVFWAEEEREDLCLAWYLHLFGIQRGQ